MKLSLTLLPSLLPAALASALQPCGAALYHPSKYSCFGTLLCPKTPSGEATIACGPACYDAGTYYCDAASHLQLITPDAAVQYCGAAPYRPGAYTCWAGNFLCPVLGGEATLACGGTACYNPREYACVDGKLGVPDAVPPPSCGGLYGEFVFWGCGVGAKGRGGGGGVEARSAQSVSAKSHPRARKNTALLHALTPTATCGYNGDPPCCSDKFFCAASKCRPFTPPKIRMVRKRGAAGST